MLHRIPWAALVFLAAACVPWLGSRFYTFLATDIAILALFAVEPEPAARLHRPRLVRPRRLFRHRRLHLRDPDEDLRRAVRARRSLRRRRNAALLGAAVRRVLRALDQDLFLDADARLRADRLGGLLQMEFGDRRRAGLQQRPLSRSRLDGGAAAARRSARRRQILSAGPRADRRSRSRCSGASSARRSAAC